MPETIASLGAGRMGRGIAHAFAYAGRDVVLIDLKQRSGVEFDQLARAALSEIDGSLAALSSLGVFDDALRPEILARVRVIAAGEAAAALRTADVIFEGVPEVMEAKRAAFEAMMPLVRDDAIIASTTSTMLVTQLAGFIPHPERFLNAHWLNPAYLLPLVELSPHPGTDHTVFDRLKRLLESIGKVPVECAPAPGFIVPRLQSLIMNEAARMVEEGVATPAAIDQAVRYGLGIRYVNLGVVEFIDYGGVDILHYAANYLAGELGERYRPPAIVGRLMDEGKKGLREGEGFYDWRGTDVAAYRRDVLSRLVGTLRHQGLLRAPG
ncbi:MAG: 3-hydroxybutyryl-CoA dehydrogenase [Betaproteobacteria bacterium]|nr:3-hydroxybutyryl-CoA dehydrogenase [Betaproteobacteria bacterium]